MATLKEDKSHEMGLHEEQLKGRTQQRFFSVDESENLTYFHSFDVDTSKSGTIDALEMTPREINGAIRELMEKGIGNITCLLYTSPSPRDQRGSRMPSSA